MVFRSFIFCVFILLGCNRNAQAKVNPLVTMSKEELFKITECISKSGNSKSCADLIECNDLAPKQVFDAWEKCNKEKNPKPLQCNAEENLYEPFSIFSEVTECSHENIKELTKEEKDMMTRLENCKRKVYINGCDACK